MAYQSILVGETEYQFPDDMSDEEIQKALKLEHSDPTPAPKEENNWRNLWNLPTRIPSGVADMMEGGDSGLDARASAVTQLGNAASLGTVDEIQGVIGARRKLAEMPEDGKQLGLGDLYNLWRQEQQSAQERNNLVTSRNEDAALSGDLASLAVPIGILGKAQKAKSVMQGVKQGMASGAKVGAVAGAGMSQNTIEEPVGLVGDTLTGMGLGAAVGGVAGGAGAGLSGKPMTYQKPLTETERLLAARFRGYKDTGNTVELLDDANKAVKGVLRELHSDFDTYLKEARSFGKISKEQVSDLQAIKAKMGQKNAPFSTDDYALISKVFGDKAPVVRELMDQSAYITSNLSDMRHIGGPLGAMMESNANPTTMQALLKKTGLTKLHEKFIQPRNPVNKLAKAADESILLRARDNARILEKASINGKIRSDDFDPNSDPGIWKGADADPVPEAPLELPVVPVLREPTAGGIVGEGPRLPRFDVDGARQAPVDGPRVQPNVNGSLNELVPRVGSPNIPRFAVDGARQAPVEGPRIQPNVNGPLDATVPRGEALPARGEFGPTANVVGGEGPRVTRAGGVAEDTGGLPTAPVDFDTTQAIAAGSREAVKASRTPSWLPGLLEKAKGVEATNGPRVTIIANAANQVEGATVEQATKAFDEVLADLKIHLGDEKHADLLKALSAGSLNDGYYSVQNMVTTRLAETTGGKIKLPLGRGRGFLGDEAAQGAEGPMTVQGGPVTIVNSNPKSQAYEAGTVANREWFRKGYQFNQTGQEGLGALQIVDPTGKHIGYAADYITARKLAAENYANRSVGVKKVAEKAPKLPKAEKPPKDEPPAAPVTPEGPPEPPPVVPPPPVAKGPQTLSEAVETPTAQSISVVRSRGDYPDRNGKLQTGDFWKMTAGTGDNAVQLNFPGSWSKAKVLEHIRNNFGDQPVDVSVPDWLAKPPKAKKAPQTLAEAVEDPVAAPREVTDPTELGVLYNSFKEEGPLRTAISQMRSELSKKYGTMNVERALDDAVDNLHATLDEYKKTIRYSDADGYTIDTGGGRRSVDDFIKGMLTGDTEAGASELYKHATRSMADAVEQDAKQAAKSVAKRKKATPPPKVEKPEAVNFDPVKLKVADDVYAEGKWNVRKQVWDIFLAGKKEGTATTREEARAKLRDYLD